MSESYQDEDGRWHHFLRQSWLKTFDLCPELARQEHFKMFPRTETDAAAIGTAVHAAIEYGDWETHTFDDLWQVYLHTFDEIASRENFRWVKYSPKKAEQFGHDCLVAWWNIVAPTLTPGAQQEVKFDLVLHQDDERTINLGGIIDYVGAPDQAVRLKDWKTSSRGEYTPWEHKRWSIQGSCYTFAAATLGMVEPQPDGSVPFEFVVLGDHGAQRFTIQRDEHDWAWLLDKAQTVCLLIEAGLPTWPKQDNHALCSPKWCPAWATCKGAHGIEY